MVETVSVFERFHLWASFESSKNTLTKFCILQFLDHQDFLGCSENPGDFFGQIPYKLFVLKNEVEFIK